MKITKNTVAICMATYNGEKFIKEQLDSILKQSYKDWVLFIRDDYSNDDTIRIIKQCIGKKIILIEDKNIIGGSSKKNFAAILKWVNKNYRFNYFMFSDQDDVWLVDKIQNSIDEVKRMELNYDGPVLVHTDLKVVDKHLNILGESFIKYRALNPALQDINHLLIQNNITGCTMCWNYKLNEKIDLSNDDIVMHDWWIALIASCFGKIGYIKQATILYRQHGNNVVGAINVNSISFIIKRLVGNTHVKQTLEMAEKQAKVFCKYFGKQLTKEQEKNITMFSEISKYNKIKRIILVFKYNFWKQGIIQKIGELIFI